MSRLPDLVHDTRLNTLFKDDITIHHYDESDDENDARSTLRLEHWEQTSHLGHGGYGDVWLQQCVSGKRGHERRAVKIIPHFRFKDKKDSYMAELEAIAKFSQRRYSKCFVKLIGWYDTDSSLYIAMEYVPLGDLEKYMSGNGPMQEADAQQVSFQILEGLSYMHREGFAHRDVKPGNVLIKSHPPKSKWWVKISDFGISKRVEGSKAQSTVRGTIQYMAPELIWHEAGNPINYMAADMWALGTMVYRMLTLMPVFATPGAYNYYLVNVNSFPLEQLKKQDASSEAILFIRSLMGPRPEERLSSDKAMEHAWVASFKSHQTQIPASPQPPSSYSANRQSTPTSDLNPWATVSTSSADISIEAQQPRNIFPRSALPISVPQTPATIDSRLGRDRPSLWEIQHRMALRRTDNKDGMSRPPTVPTPPPAPNQASVFPVPEEDDPRRSSAARRGSIESNHGYNRKPSREPVADFVPMAPHAMHNMAAGRRGRLQLRKLDREERSLIEQMNSTPEGELMYPRPANQSNSLTTGIPQDDHSTDEDWLGTFKIQNPKTTGTPQDYHSTDEDRSGTSQIQGNSRADSRAYNSKEPRSFFTNPSLFTAKPMNNTVLVNNIAYRTTPYEIGDFFGFCGKITNLQVTTKDNMISAKVTYEEETAAEKALLLDNTELGPNTITVVKASEQEAAHTGSQSSYWMSIKTSLAEVFKRPEIDVPINAPQNNLPIIYQAPLPPPPGWELDYDGRWLYRYTLTGHVQYHYPRPGDEFVRPETRRPGGGRPGGGRPDGGKPPSP